MYSLRKAQIAHLKVDETLTKVSSEYADFANVFSLKLTAELLKHIRINNHTIELIDDWQPSYGPIYRLGPMELKTLKIYIENNLANSFIRLFKSFVGALIFFDK